MINHYPKKMHLLIGDRVFSSIFFPLSLPHSQSTEMYMDLSFNVLIFIFHRLIIGTVTGFSPSLRNSQ